MSRSTRDPAPLVERLRKRGWRLTPQRRAIAEAFAGGHLHLTADEVFERARRRLPEVSRATVYNTLSELVAMTELGEVRVAPGPVRFDARYPQYHHHLVCEDCGRIEDVVAAGLEGVSVPRRQRQGFTISEVDVVFRGRCADCSTNQRKRRSRR